MLWVLKMMDKKIITFYKKKFLIWTLVHIKTFAGFGEMLKSEGNAGEFQHLPRGMGNLNALNNPQIITKLSQKIAIPKGTKYCPDKDFRLMEIIQKPSQHEVILLICNILSLSKLCYIHEASGHNSKWYTG